MPSLVNRLPSGNMPGSREEGRRVEGEYVTSNEGSNQFYYSVNTNVVKGIASENPVPAAGCRRRS
jgi:hypothetical protein